MRGSAPASWRPTWALALVFGVASIPWTYAFVAGIGIPLWPSFIGSATYYAAGEGPGALVRGAASTVAGIAYGAATIAVVDTIFGGSVAALSLVVGVFMFLACLHALVPPLSFTPGGFLGYATMFSVHAADATALGLAGLTGQTVAAGLSMLIGVAIGFVIDELRSARSVVKY